VGGDEEREGQGLALSIQLMRLIASRVEEERREGVRGEEGEEGGGGNRMVSRIQLVGLIESGVEEERRQTRHLSSAKQRQRASRLSPRRAPPRICLPKQRRL
jgi:hypothetical protein